MDRRNIFRTMIAAIAGAVATRASADTGAKADGVPKVVYHLADADKVSFVLGNIKNHIEGMGGPDKVTIALVVHGPALRSFQHNTTDADLKTKVGGMSKSGVGLHACVNTLRGMDMKLTDLLPGFVLADKGGVVRLADLQQQGYIYLRP
jgi:intracellular sulfur oxidation DsrE/DsrF family protein